MKTVLWLMYGALSIYCILDGVHTATLISLGYEEANPVIAYLVDRFGIGAMFAVKAAWLALLGFAIKAYMVTDRRG